MEAMTTSSSLPPEIQPEYARLLASALPAIIQDDAQNEGYLRQIEALLEREEELTGAERELLALMTLLVESYESKHYELAHASPVAVLRFLIDQQSLRQKDLADVFGTPSIVSEVLSGKRELNKEQIRRLSERFHLSPELFF
jgi:HTH-type transcriptional regulator/antitoxin HigA